MEIVILAKTFLLTASIIVVLIVTLIATTIMDNYQADSISLIRGEFD